MENQKRKFFSRTCNGTCFIKQRVQSWQEVIPRLPDTHSHKQRDSEGEKNKEEKKTKALQKHHTDQPERRPSRTPSGLYPAANQRAASSKMSWASCSGCRLVESNVCLFLSFHKFQPTRKNKESKPRLSSFGRSLRDAVHQTIIRSSCAGTSLSRRNALRQTVQTSLLKTHPRIMWSRVSVDPQLSTSTEYEPSMTWPGTNKVTPTPYPKHFPSF